MDFQNQNSFSYQDLIHCANSKLFGLGNPQLPNTPMLMFDRITHISSQGGGFGKGEVIAELDIKPDLWFFNCHFVGDPVMPGCLGLDAMWQLVGFYLGWIGGQGHGRALGANEIKFTGQVLPKCEKVVYHIDMQRVIKRDLFVGFANGTLSADNKVIYTAKRLQVGLFKNTEGF